MLSDSRSNLQTKGTFLLLAAHLRVCDLTQQSYFVTTSLSIYKYFCLPIFFKTQFYHPAGPCVNK